MTEVFLLGGVRTPHGRYGGSLRDVPVVELGALAARASIERAGVPASAVDEVVVSNCRQAGNGPNPGRQMALRAGVPEPVPALTINMACASGLKAIQLAHRSVAAGEAEIALAIAAESMSRMPYLASSELRWGGVKRGDIVLRDGWQDGGTDPICDMNMGQTAEKVAATFGIEREAQDAWSARSHDRVAAAWREGRFDAQIVRVPLADAEWLERDETFREASDPAKLGDAEALLPGRRDGHRGQLEPDGRRRRRDRRRGGAAIRAHGLKPRARLRSFAAVGVDPTMMGIGPTEAIPARARVRRCHDRRRGRDRDQRGVRRPDRAERPRPRARRGAGERQRWGHRARTSDGTERLPARGHAPRRAGASRRDDWPGESLRRRRDGRCGRAGAGRMSVEGLRVVVVGLGPMGRGIARVFAEAGADVSVHDLDAATTAAGLAQILADAPEGLTVHAASTLEHAVASADLLVEAIVERPEAKAALLAQVRAAAPPGLVVASNTSSLSIGELGVAYGLPERVVGMHFFNPPEKMRLVEVVRGPQTAEDVVASAEQWATDLGKTVVVCADSPNFIVNRVCRPLYYEAQLLATQGLAPPVVDAVARGALGHRMGPLELLDFAGLHTHLGSSETAHRELGDPRYRPIPRTRSLVRAGATGRAAGQGWYDYATAPPADARAAVLRERPRSSDRISVGGPRSRAPARERTRARCNRGRADPRRLLGSALVQRRGCRRRPRPRRPRRPGRGRLVAPGLARRAAAGRRLDPAARAP